MNIHEHQAKELYRQYGIPTGKGAAAFTVDEAVEAAKQLPGPVWVVKAQIHAGGRGKGTFKEKEAGEKGGVRLAKSVDEVKQFAGEMLGRTLVTVQTGDAGRVVRRLYVEDGTAIDKELYLSMLVDRATSRVAFIVSTEGGMDIEKVAHDTPEKIVTLSIDPASGFQPFHGRKIAFALGLKGDAFKQMQATAANLYRMFIEKDMSLLEINPLVVTKEGNLIALDGKMDFDSNSLFRHPEIVAYRDITEEEPSEIEASKHDLAFIKLDGNIGCLVNGAGPCHGDDGHHQALRRRACELPRCRRRRFEGEGAGSVQADPRRSGCEGHLGQHLRRHHALRHHRGRRDRSGT